MTDLDFTDNMNIIIRLMFKKKKKKLVGAYLRSSGGGLKIFTGADCDSGGHTVLLICKKEVNFYPRTKTTLQMWFPFENEIGKQDLFELLKSFSSIILCLDFACPYFLNTLVLWAMFAKRTGTNWINWLSKINKTWMACTFSYVLWQCT